MNYEDQIVQAVKKVMPAVVSITATKDLEILKRAARDLGYPPPIDALQGSDEALGSEGIPTTEDGKVRMGGGSGFIIDKRGIILTNRHVVMDTDADYTIITHDETTYPVRVVARDPIHDVAILKITAENIPTRLPTVTFAEEKNLALGQTVIAIGNALGEFKNTVSTGVISGLSRLISAITDMSGHQERLRGLIQTDAAINPGNSGGPLIDINGKVIGVNVAIVFGAQNIGFAIPIKKAKRDIDDIRLFGHIRRPFLGVRYIVLNKHIAKRFGLPVEHGALILKEMVPGDHAVIPGSPAEKAGLREGDIILAYNGKTVTEKETLEDMLENMNVSDELNMDILRNGTAKETVRVTLEERR